MSEKDNKPSGPLNAKGELDLSCPEAIIADALGILRYQDVVGNPVLRNVSPLPKLEIFAGSPDPGTWEAIDAYIAGGSRGTLTEVQQHFLDLLNLIFSLDGQYGKRNTIRFLTCPHFRFSYQKASELYTIAIELFHANRKISKDAMRAKTADQLEAAYVAAISVAKTAKDYLAAAQILKIKAQVLGLGVDDPKVLDAGVYMRPFRVFSIDPESIGLQRADRRKLAELIDSIPDLAQSDKIRLYRDSGIIDMDITEMINNESQEAASN